MFLRRRPRPLSPSEYWDLHARRDPFWAVLASDAKRGRRWAAREFMQHGEAEISVLFHHLAGLGLAFPRRAALDFGCGPGRVTQALGRRFDTVVGLDISPRMVGLARRLNAMPSVVRYLAHNRPGLARVPAPFDLIYSNLVLQHVEPDLTRRYLRALVGALSAEGLFIFQLPSHEAPARPPVTPMPAEAYDAAVEIIDAPRRADPAAEFEVTARVCNRSPLPWDQKPFGSLRLGNHWLLPPGGMLIRDDGRTALPARLDAGACCTLKIGVKPPSRPGEYLLELDVVHEGVAWFVERCSSAARLSMSVGDSAPSGSSDPPSALEYEDRVLQDALEPMEDVPLPDEVPMHAIDRDSVLRTIEDAGGVAVRVEDDDSAGPEWVSCRYLVRRAPR